MPGIRLSDADILALPPIPADNNALVTIPESLLRPQPKPRQKDLGRTGITREELFAALDQEFGSPENRVDRAVDPNILLPPASVNAPPPPVIEAPVRPSEVPSPSRSAWTDIPRGAMRGLGQIVESAGGALQALPYATAGLIENVMRAPARERLQAEQATQTINAAQRLRAADAAQRGEIVLTDASLPEFDFSIPRYARTELAPYPDNPMELAGRSIARSGREIQSSDLAARDESVVSPFGSEAKQLADGDRLTNALRWAQSSLGEQIPQMALSMGLSRALQSAGKAAEVIGFAAPTAIQEGGGDYEQLVSTLIDQGVAEGEAKKRAGLMLALRGGTAAAMELAPFEGIMGEGAKLAGGADAGLTRRVASRFGRGGIAEMPAEIGQELAGGLFNTAAGDPHGMDRMPQRVAEAGTLAFLAGGLAGGAMAGESAGKMKMTAAERKLAETMAGSDELKQTKLQMARQAAVSPTEVLSAQRSEQAPSPAMAISRETVVNSPESDYSEITEPTPTAKSSERDVSNKIKNLRSVLAQRRAQWRNLAETLFGGPNGAAAYQQQVRDSLNEIPGATERAQALALTIPAELQPQLYDLEELGNKVIKLEEKIYGLAKQEMQAAPEIPAAPAADVIPQKGAPNNGTLQTQGGRQEVAAAPAPDAEPEVTPSKQTPALPTAAPIESVQAAETAPTMAYRRPYSPAERSTRQEAVDWLNNALAGQQTGEVAAQRELSEGSAAGRPRTTGETTTTPPFTLDERPLVLKSTRTRLAELVARKVFGRTLVPIRGGEYAPAVAGVYANSNPDFIYWNTATEHPVLRVVAHEAGHALVGDLQGSAELNQYWEALGQSMDVARWVRDYRQRHPIAANQPEHVLREEVLADQLAQNIANPKFWRAVRDANPTVFNRLAWRVMDLIDRIDRALRDRLNPRDVEKQMNEAGLLKTRALLAKLVAEGQRRTADRRRIGGDTATTTRGERESTVGRPWVYYHPGIEQRFNVHYRLVPVNAVVASHNAQSFAPRPEYPQQVQPRDYARDKEEQVKVISGAARLNPYNMVSNEVGPAGGPPMVVRNPERRSQWIALGGNGRTMMIQRALELHPQQYQQYRTHLAERAGEFGLTPEAVKSDTPMMLVREMDLTPQEWELFARESNRKGTLEYDEISEAINLARNLDERVLLQGINLDGDQTIADVLNDADKVDRFIDALRSAGAITNQNSGKYVRHTADGDRLTEAGRRLVEQALMAKVFEGPNEREALNLIQQWPALQRSLSASLTPLVQVKRLLEQGLDPAYDLAGIVYQLAEAARRTGTTNLEDFEATNDWVTPLAADDRTAARILLPVLTSPAKLRERLKGYAALAESALNNQGGMLPLERSQVLQGWADELGLRLLPEEKQATEPRREPPQQGELFRSTLDMAGTPQSVLDRVGPAEAPPGVPDMFTGEMAPEKPAARSARPQPTAKVAQPDFLRFMPSEERLREIKGRYDVTLPVIISGHEIDAFDEPLNMKELRAKARTWAAKQLPRSVTNQETGWKIEVRPSGVRSALAHGSGPVKIQAIAGIGELLKRAVLITTDHRTSGPWLDRHVFAAPLKVGGTDYHVGLVVREDTGGRLFYDHELMEVESPSGIPSQAGASPKAEQSPPGGLPVHSILQTMLGVNASEKTGEGEAIPTGEDLRFMADRREASDNEQETLKPKNLREKAAAIRERGLIDWAKSKFRARGDLPQEVFELNELRQASIGAEQTRLKHLEADLDRAINVEYKSKFNMPADVRNTLNRALHGGRHIAKLPLRLQAPVIALRARIDELSVQLLDSGMVDGPLKATLEKRLGSYVHRSYRISDEGEKWLKVIPRQAYDSAIAWTRDNMIRNRAFGRLDAAEEAWRKEQESGAAQAGGEPAIMPARDMFDYASEDAIRREIAKAEEEITWQQAESHLLNFLFERALKPDQRSSPPPALKIGQKDLSIFMRRTNVAPEIRAVMGEYEDAEVNAAKTITKQSMLLANETFLRKVRNAGMGVYLFEPGDAPIGFNAKIAAEGSQVLAPLNGLFTAPEIVEAFEALDKSKEVDHWFWTGLMAVNAFAKTMKTVGSVMTQSRNLLGQPFFHALSGHFNLSRYGAGLRAVLTDWGRMRSSEQRERLYHYVELGLLHNSAIAEELRNVMSDAGLRLNQQYAPAKTRIRKFLRVWRPALNAPIALYEASDSLGKIVGFENEAARQRRVHPDWTTEQVEREAVTRVLNTYPTYSRVSKFFQQARRQPFFGPFVAFNYEALRTLWHSARYAALDLRSDNKAQRLAGAERLAGLSLALGSGAVLALASRLMLGLSPDDDKDFRRFLPDWSRSSTMIMLSRNLKDGRASAFDLSSYNPYNTFTDSFSELMMAAWTFDASHVKNAAKEILDPWVSEQLFFSRLMDVRSNKTQTGQRVYNPEDSPTRQAASIGKYVGMALLPGTVERIFRKIIPALRGQTTPYGQKLDPAVEITAELTGARVTNIDYRQALQFKMRNFIRASHDVTTQFTNPLTSMSPISPQSVLDDYLYQEGRRMKLWRETYDTVRAARRQGVPDHEIVPILDAAGWSRANAVALARARYEPYSLWSRTGTAGSALERARQIDPKRVPVKELKALERQRRGLGLED
jgi:hypothetical protein